LIGYFAAWLDLLLIVLAVVTGLLFMDTGELTNYGIRYLTLFAVAAALNAVPFVGPYITAIAQAMVGFFGYIILTVLLVFNFNQAVKWFTSD
jgi:hypothetical protein